VSIVEAERVTYAVDGATIVEEISLTVRGGEFACIVGPNGAGKTTIMRLLAGELAASGGRTTIDGEDPAGTTVADRARMRAFLAQSERSDVPFPVRTVVGFGTHLSSLDRSGQDALIAEAMSSLGIDRLSERVMSSLSGGEQKRVAVARTFAQDAPVILLDEPTDSLDLAHADAVMARAGDYAAEGRTVIVTSHDLNLAARHADRVVVLDRGRVVADGSPTDVLDATLLSRVYGCVVRVMPHPVDGRPVVFL
jgi:iron complex transport system ATP-binding protein